MSIRNSADISFFLIGGFSVVGTLTTITDGGVEAEVRPTTVFGTSWETHQYVGLRGSELTQEGFFDDAAGSVHDALGGGTSSTGVGSSRVLCYGVAGTATGAQFIGWEGAREITYERNFSLGEFHKAKATYRSDGAVEPGGRIVRMYAVHTATGATTGSPLDNTVSSTGGSAYLQYNATAGEANIRMLHSSDNITYATLFTFTKTASGFGAERLTTTGVIERYTALDVTTASATGSIAALNTFMGLQRGALTT